MERPEGFEPSTRRLENGGSYPLSYGRMEEGSGIEPLRPLLTGYGLASRPIATLATFLNLADSVGIEPTRRFTSRPLGFQDRGLTSQPAILNSILC
jgi:hypothetical protein